MSQETQHPTLIIKSPDGTIIKLYQELTPECIKEILDQFMVTEKLVK
ncbi:(2Fe-2S) ferredoxin [Pedobacter africanus]|uniref:(2Fe-2S) ferredoxin n=1 Tax=Pedobacter africanus TaxID=151894 RepID=A0ACC6KU37_9SPHI|nr:hypothetical protein [Pedobacter africanus]MDR6782702.1 (2Fe-2S) ferredoxin [Pedobacter africanus]